jgi:type II secretory pathway pseudopilin PulG
MSFARPLPSQAFDPAADAKDLRIMKSPGCWRAFSLIELLVIVAVLGVLIALLLPALKLARARAQDAHCASNLRQNAMGMSAYATMHRDWFPPYQIDAQGLLTFSDHLHRAGILAGLAKNNAHVDTTFLCPEYDMTTFATQYSQLKTTYAVNVWVTGSHQIPGWIVAATRRRNIARPAAVTLLGDGVYALPNPPAHPAHVYLNFSYGFEIGKYWMNSDRYLPDRWTRYAHLESPLAAFVDGHVEQRPGPWPTMRP